MGRSTYATAFLLLAGLTIVGTAGIAALDASHSQTNSTLNGTNSDSPGVLEMGKDVQSALATALPWLALLAVPIGIVGLLVPLAVAFSDSSGGRR